jgi:hypothetical protein
MSKNLVMLTKIDREMRERKLFSLIYGQLIKLKRLWDSVIGNTSHDIEDKLTDIVKDNERIEKKYKQLSITGLLPAHKKNLYETYYSLF